MARVYVCDHRLDNDYCRVDYHAEVYRSERHQVAVDAECLHHAEGEEHAEWNDRRHDKSCTPVAEEQHEHEYDYESTLNEVACYRALNPSYEVGAVDERLDDHSFGQRTLYLCDAFLHVAAHFLEVFAFEHDGNACHNLAFAVTGDGSEACGVALLHLCHVADAHGCGAYRLDRYVGNVVQRAHAADATYVVLVCVFFYIAASGVCVVALKSRVDVCHGHSAGV